MRNNREVKMKEQKLKPCPFCGSKMVGISQSGRSGQTEVYCHKCFSAGSLAMIPERAIELWNRRAKNV